MNFQRPIVATFSTKNLQHNALLVKNKFAKNSKFFAVIKANAYGHGQLFAVDALKNIADGFALLECENAVILRENNLISADKKIILLEGIFSSREAKQIVDFNIISVVHCVEQLQWILEQFDKNKQQNLEIAIKFNTGMNRLGFTEQNFNQALNLLEKFDDALKNSRLKVILMTHFATADENTQNKGISKAIRNFQNLEKMFQQKFPNLNYQKCLANSAAICETDFSKVHYDWVRPGIMLYGSSPFGLQKNKTAQDLDLRPVMSLHSKIIAIQNIGKGETIGYGETFTAEKPMKIGVVACGYADGYLRSSPSGTPLMINNQRSKTVGRISMDMLCCDLTEISGEVGVGTPVTLWGEGIAGNLPIDELAECAGTISYELCCRVAERVKRKIID